MDPLTQAREAWIAGDGLAAGRLLLSCLPREDQPGWAAEVLELLAQKTRSLDVVQDVIQLARDHMQWSSGQGVFQRVREAVLSLEHRGVRQDAPEYMILLLAEGVAKLSYNCSGEEAPFDADSGWWIPSIALSLLARLGDPQLREAVEGSLFRTMR